MKRIRVNMAADGMPGLRKLAFVAGLALCIFALGVVAPAQTIITFDPPGSVLTSPQAINNAGTITGLYGDANFLAHGFVRSSNGTITSFDVPGSGTQAGQGTVGQCITPRGDIAGFYVDASNVFHGYLRARDGSITTFDAPGAGTSPGLGTQALSINPAGEIQGDYADPNNVVHGFVRATDGTITVYDAPGAGTGSGQGTYGSYPDGLTPSGEAAGNYLDSSNVWHGYVRARDGSFTEIDVPGAGTGPGQGTVPNGLSINPSGTTTGNYVDASGVSHGFVRTADGTITTFDVPGAGTGPGQGTGPGVINPGGDITSSYTDAANVSHGYLRTKQGAITTFDVPGAGTGSGQGTGPFSNNPRDSITGWYVDSNGVQHGFLRTAH